MEYTTNYNLKKPDDNDLYTQEVQNDNMDIIDAALQNQSAGSGELTSLTTTEKTSLVGAINEVDGDVGDLTGLTTSDKDSLVDAINELDGNIGDLSGLTTTAKTNLVNAVNELSQNMFVIGTNRSQNGQLTLTTPNVFEKIIEIPNLPVGTYIATVRMQYNDGMASTNVISWVSIIKDNETSSTGPGNAVTIPGGTGYPGASITRIITLESPGAISAWARSSNGSAMFTGMLQVIRIK